MIEEPDRAFDRRGTQVHVPLRRGQVRMTGQLLNRHRRSPPHGEVRAEGVPEDVNASVVLQPRPPLGGRHPHPNHLLRRRSALIRVQHARPLQVSQPLESVEESIRHRLHFQALLALPLLTATMALGSAGFSMRPTLRGGVARMIGGGVATGFALFLISKVTAEFGQSGALPVVLAAWAPTLSGLMLAVALLLHTEDG